ncbi:MAG: glycosyltransferase family 87 protein [Stellaceae bacterium]
MKTAIAIGLNRGAALTWPPASHKFRVLAGIFLTLFAVYGAADLAVAITRGWPGGFGDSFALWSFGRFLRDHVATAIYDPVALRSAQLTLGMAPGASYPFPYPPSFLLVVWPLGQLPGWLACAALVAVSLPLYLWATLGRNWHSPALAAALAAPTTAIAIVSGQSGFLAAALLVGGLRLAASYPAAGGVLFGLLTYKPQLGLLVPVAIVAARLWRTLIAAGVTAILLVAVTSLLFGGAIWPSWVALLPAFSRQFTAESSQVIHLMPTILVALVRLGATPATAQLAQWVGTAGAAAIVWMLFRAGPPQLAGAGLLVAAVLATPYAFVYDMPGITTAVIWLVAERQRAGDALGTGEVLVTILAMLCPITLVAGTSRFPFATLVLILLLGAIVRRWRRLLTQTASSQPLSAMSG